jgi:hypothetical protein
MKIRHITETTAGATSSASVASVAKPVGKTLSRGNLFKGKKTKKPFYEEEISEQDLIIVPGQGKKLKPGLITKDKDRTDHEVEMARSDLYQAAKNAQTVYALIKDISEEEGLEGWVQEKIIKANDYLNTIREYLEHKTHMNETGGVIAGGMSNFEEATVNEISNFKKDELKRELAHEKNNYAVAIDGRVWKVFADEQQAKNIARSLERKGKKATVHLTGASVNEGKEHKCPECGGEMVSEELMNEKKDACYYKVKSRYKVWPSAYASGALVKCRKKGAKNWGSKSK